MVLLLCRWPSLLGRCMRDRSLPDRPQGGQWGPVVEDDTTAYINGRAVDTGLRGEIRARSLFGSVAADRICPRR